MTPPLPTPLTAVEAMARAHTGVARFQRMGEERDDRALRAMQSALTALCALYPGVAEVIAGSAVVVPREADDELRRVVWRAQYEHRRSVGGPELQVSDEGIAELTERRVNNPVQRAQDRAAYAAQMAASPYAPPAPGAEGGA